MLHFIIQIVDESARLWIEIAPYLLLGMFIAGVLHVFISQDTVVHHLGGRNFGSILKATVFGIPLPICSCGVIPVAASLRKEGASKSATLSFLVSTPTTGVDSILATYSLLGPLFTLFRPLAAFFSGIFIGTVSHVTEKEEKQHRDSHSHDKLPRHIQLLEIIRYGFGELVEDIGKWLIVGIIVGGILTVIIPENLIATRLANPILQFGLMLIVSVPLYVCATGSIPIAASLILKGLSPGAALVFLIAGPATNTVTLSFVLSKLGKKAFAVYLGSIVIVSLVAGWIFNVIWRLLGADIGLVSGHGAHLPSVLQIGSGLVLVLLVIKSMLPVKEKGHEMKYNIPVSDISCKHCKMTLEHKIGELEGVREVSVDVDHRMVHVDGDIELDQIKQTIKNAGYSPGA